MNFFPMGIGNTKRCQIPEMVETHLYEWIQSSTPDELVSIVSDYLEDSSTNFDQFIHAAIERKGVMPFVRAAFLKGATKEWQERYNAGDI